MLERKHAIFAAAALAALPLTSKAVTVTFQFDAADFMVETGTAGPLMSVTAAGGTLTGTTTNPILTIPVGDYFVYGLDAEITGNNGLGLAAYQTGITNSTLSATSTAVVQPGPTVVAAFFSSNAAAGIADGVGGVNPTLGTAGSYVAGGTTSAAKTTYGAGAFANLYSGQRVKPLATSNATFTLTPSNLTLAMQYITKGTNGTSPTYSNTTFVPGVDVMNAMPVLTVVYGSSTGTGTGSGTGSGTGTGTTTQSIVSLTTTAPTSYGSQLGSTITLTYTGPGGYVPGYTTFGASNKGFGIITGFKTPDTEIYALDVLNASGGALTSAQITAVISDINKTGSGVTASLITGVYTNLFKGYDVLLTGTTAAVTGSSYYLAFDFSATGDTDAVTQGFTVGAIAAVPEPATMTLGVIGAAGLLLGRRKNQSVAA